MNGRQIKSHLHRHRGVPSCAHALCAAHGDSIGCTATDHPGLRLSSSFRRPRKLTLSGTGNAPSSQRLDSAKRQKLRAVGWDRAPDAFFHPSRVNVYTSRRIALGKPPPIAETYTGAVVSHRTCKAARWKGGTAVTEKKKPLPPNLTQARWTAVSSAR